MGGSRKGLSRRRLTGGMFSGLVGALVSGCGRGAGNEASNVVALAAGDATTGVSHSSSLGDAVSSSTVAAPIAPQQAEPSASVAAPTGSAPSETIPAGATTSAGAMHTSNRTIYLQPLGVALVANELEYIEAALAAYFPFPIRRLPTEALPANAYYAPRKRYRAERLLDYLETRTPSDAQVVIGLTEADISTTKGDVYDWGILGLATISGQQCVISRFRAQRGAKDATHVRQRLAKTVVHEVGHTIGLPHCPNYGCVMEDGKGSVLTTDHERDVCSECRARVGSLMLPVPATLPW